MRKHKNPDNSGKIVLPGKKTTITFTIDKNFLNSIRKEAEREGMSVNAKMNTILQRYALCYTYTEKEHSMVVPFKSTELMLNHLEEQKLLEYYKSIVHDLIPAKFKQNKIPLTLQNWVRNFCNGMMVYSGSIESFSNYLDDEGHLCLAYSHNHGIKWSKVLALVLSNFIEDVLSYHTSCSISPSSVVIKILERNVEGI